MADPRAVSDLKANAEQRLRRAAVEAARLSGVEFTEPQVPSYEPALKSARTIEAVADLLERLNTAQENDHEYEERPTRTRQQEPSDGRNRPAAAAR